MYSFAVEVPCGRRKFRARATGCCAWRRCGVTDARAVDDGEVRVRLSRRQQAAGAAVPALGRKRAEEGASGGGGDGVDEEGTVLACSPGSLDACVKAVALFVGLERVALVCY